MIGAKSDHRPLDRRAGNLRLVGRAHRDQFIARRNGSTGLASRRVLNAALLASVHHLQQFSQRVQALGKADVGVELNQDLLGFADGQSRIQPLVQGGVELGHVARGHEGRDQRNGLLLGGKGFGVGWCASHGLRLRGVLSVRRRLRRPAPGSESWRRPQERCDA